MTTKTARRRARGDGSFRKRGNSFLLTWSMTGPDGQRKQLYETLKPEPGESEAAHKKRATDRLKELTLKAGKPGAVVPTSDSLAGWFDYWVSDVLEAKDQSRDWYRRMFANHIPEALQGKKLKAITKFDIQQVQSTARRKGMSATTRRKVHGVLFGLFKAAVKAELLDAAANPMLAIESPKKDKRRVEIPTLEKVRAVMACIPDVPHKAAYTLLLATGARRGEIAALTWEDVDLDAVDAEGRPAPYIRINKAVVRLKGRGLVIDTPKTLAGNRVVHIDADTVAVLRRHRAEQAARILASGGAVRDLGYCFTATDGTIFDPQNLTCTWVAAAKRAGVSVRLHGLRHLHASLLLASGKANVKEMQDRLGHADAATTLNVYSHVLPGRGQQIASGFGELIGVAK